LLENKIGQEYNLLGKFEGFERMGRVSEKGTKFGQTASATSSAQGLSKIPSLPEMKITQRVETVHWSKATARRSDYLEVHVGIHSPRFDRFHQ
jgi:hypothetical protein